MREDARPVNGEATARAARSTWTAVPTPRMRELLRARYPIGEWAFMEEVAPRTGGGTRYADAVAVNLWHSRGHVVLGFELKMSRGDWLREVRDASKCEEGVYRYCDHWIVVAPKGMVKEDEIPVTWGLLEATAAGLTMKKQPPRLEPRPLDRMFFASLMRRAHEQIGDLADARYQDKLRQMQTEVDRRVESGIARADTELATLKARVARFEEQSGVKIDSDWRHDGSTTIRVAQAIGSLAGYRDPRPFGRLDDTIGEAMRLFTQAREAIAPFVGEEPAR